MRGLAAQISFDVGDAQCGLEKCMHHDRFLNPRACLELRKESIDVVDVPGAFDLWNHDDVELVSDFGDKRR